MSNAFQSWPAVISADFRGRRVAFIANAGRISRESGSVGDMGPAQAVALEFDFTASLVCASDDLAKGQAGIPEAYHRAGCCAETIEPRKRIVWDRSVSSDRLPLHLLDDSHCGVLEQNIRNLKRPVCRSVASDLRVSQANESTEHQQSNFSIGLRMGEQQAHFFGCVNFNLARLGLGKLDQVSLGFADWQCLLYVAGPVEQGSQVLEEMLSRVKALRSLSHPMVNLLGCLLSNLAGELLDVGANVSVDRGDIAGAFSVFAQSFKVVGKENLKALWDELLALVVLLPVIDGNVQGDAAHALLKLLVVAHLVLNFGRILGLSASKAGRLFLSEAYGSCLVFLELPLSLSSEVPDDSKACGLLVDHDLDRAVFDRLPGFSFGGHGEIGQMDRFDSQSFSGSSQPKISNQPETMINTALAGKETEEYGDSNKFRILVRQPVYPGGFTGSAGQNRTNERRAAARKQPRQSPGHGKCAPLFSSDDADLASLNWCADLRGYARRLDRVFAHRIVGARVAGKDLTRSDVVDHINGNKLDNRRENIRITDHQGNAQNRTDCGKFRGTGWHKQVGKWQASVGHKGKTLYLGLFVDREEAARVAADKRRELNFLSSEPVEARL